MTIILPPQNGKEKLIIIHRTCYSVVLDCKIPLLITKHNFILMLVTKATFFNMQTNAVMRERVRIYDSFIPIFFVPFSIINTAKFKGFLVE